MIHKIKNANKQKRPDIDILRGLAVFGVIIYHGFPDFFPLGLLGVDIFFVVSGYLIFPNFKDIEHSRFNILHFLKRRFLRIYPMLLVVIILTAILAWFSFDNDLHIDNAKASISSIMMLSNFYFLQTLDYFSVSAELAPLIHLWSLSVEFQIYIGIAFLGLIASWFKLRKTQILFIIIFCIVSSYLLIIIGPRNNSAQFFYGAEYRVWEFFIGALVKQQRIILSNKTEFILKTAIFLLIIFNYIFLIHNTNNILQITLVNILTIFYLIINSKENGKTFVKLFFLFRFLGVISFSVYLLHQPLLAFYRINSIAFLTYGEILEVLSVVIGISFITQKYIESPFLNTRTNKVSSKIKLIFLNLTFIPIVIFFLSVIINNGFEDRSRGGPLKRMVPNYGLNKICEGKYTEDPVCSTSEKPEVLVWGDSYAMHLIPGIIASDPDIKLRQHTLSACSPTLGLAHIDKNYNEESAQNCINFNNSVFDWLKKNDTVKYVILSSPFGWLNKSNLYTNKKTLIPATYETVEPYLRNTINKIRGIGKKVVFVSRTPVSGFNNRTCIFEKETKNSKVSCDFKLEFKKEDYKLLENISDIINIYHLSNDFCKNGKCKAKLRNIYLFGNTNHISEEGSKYLGKQNNWSLRFKSIAK